jgi:predicted DNA-binding transcriptional regulator YafY
MPEPISKVQRWLDLIAYLVGRHFPVPVEELMEGLPAYARDWVEGDETARASVRRKFERDKDELRDLGIPLETVTYTINFGQEEAQGYRISRKDFFLPYVKLLRRELAGPAKASPRHRRGLLDRIRRPEAPPASELASPPPPEPAPSREETLLFAEKDLSYLGRDGSLEVPEDVAADAVWGLRELADLPGFPLAPAARSAYRKFTFDLDPADISSGKVVYAVPPETARAEEHLDALSDALLRRKKVAFGYRGIQRDQVTERKVRPWGLLFKHSHWYLVGWDETREGERIFRVDRMEAVRVNPSAPATPDYEMPDEPVLDAYRDQEAWELGETEEAVQAVVRFRFPTSLWAARNGYGEPLGEGDEGSTLRRFQVRQPNPFLRWILSLEGEAVIESPQALKDALRTMARQVADLYTEDADA